MAENDSAALADAAPKAPPVGVLTAIRDRRFALYLIGQLVSQVGDGVYVVALPFIVLDQAGGVADLGVVLSCYGVARLVLFPVGGSLSDRLSARRVMLAADILRAVTVITFALAAAHGQLALWVLIAIAVPIGAFDGLFLPASYAVLPEIVDRKALGAANSLTSTMQSTAQIMGPSIGGVVVGTVRGYVGLLVDGVTFVASTVALAAIGHRPPDTESTAAATDPAEQAAEQSTSDGWRDVLGFLNTSSLLKMSLLVTLVVNIADAGMIEVALPTFVKTTLDRGAGSFGLLMVGFGFGSALGAVCAPRFLQLRRRALIALYLGVLQGLALICVPLGSSFAMAVAAMFVAAALQAVLNVFYLTMLQNIVPAGMLGRVMSLLVMCAGVAYPVSTVLAGDASRAIGPAFVMTVAGACVSVAFLIGFVSRPYRNL